MDCEVDQKKIVMDCVWIGYVWGVMNLFWNSVRMDCVTELGSIGSIEVFFFLTLNIIYTKRAYNLKVWKLN